MVKLLSILIVDENREMMAMLRRFLACKGINVRTATRIAEAETLLTQYAFQVVLIDLFWPSNNGLRLVRHVRKVAPLSRVIVMATFPEVETHHHAFVAGADVCLDKPFRLQKLWDAVQKVLPPCHTVAQA